jgi:hypothetical protein
MPGFGRTLPSLVMFEFRFFERVTIVVITAGHIETFPCRCELIGHRGPMMNRAAG